MIDDTLEASVNYGDFAGTAAGDRHDQRSLSDLARKHGVDTDRYFVLGLNIYIGETRGDELAYDGVSILAVDTQVIGTGSVDVVQQYVDAHDGVLPYESFAIEASLEEVLLSFKRFNVVLKNARIERVREWQRA